MKLKEFIEKNSEAVSEMAMGDDEASATTAAELINKQAPLVISGKGKDVGAMYGSLKSALTAIGKTNAPEKYMREVKLAKAALAKIDAYNKTVQSHDTPSMAASCNTEKKKKACMDTEAKK